MLRYIPNGLSIIRLLLVPVFIGLFFSESQERLLLSLGIYILAGVTDVLDGYLARKNNWVTPLGTVLDPLADKLMLLTVLACLVFEHFVPLFVLLIILAKEAIMISMGIYMYLCKEKMVIPSNNYGKVATGMFSLAILLLMLQVNKGVSTTVLIFAVVLKLIAFLSYSKYYLNHARRKDR